ncbi:MAG: ABC transporter permease [Aerococcaceae bacterium]|nr:ABC transporter permease [Aerococcaceae bacterium]
MSESNNVTKQDAFDLRKNVQKIETRFEVYRTVMAIAIAMAIVLVVIALLSDNPLESIQLLLTGPLTSLRRFGNVIELMIPLTFTGLAITLTFKTNRFNLISDGTFFLGAMIATLVALFSPFPFIVNFFITFVLTFVIGGMLGFIPAFLNFKFGASELVTSLMMNYIIGYFVNFLLNHVVRDLNSSVLQSHRIDNAQTLPKILDGTRIHFGLFIALAFTIAIYLIVYKTKWGYELRTTGLNEKFSKYVGVNVVKVIILAQVLGAGIASFGGAVELLGIYNNFKWTSSPGYGFDGVIIATLARNNPLYVPVAAFFLAYIRIGADVLNRSTDIPSEIISVVQATIILLIAAKAFLSKWKQRSIVKMSQAANSEGGN